MPGEAQKKTLQTKELAKEIAVQPYRLPNMLLHPVEQALVNSQSILKWPTVRLFRHEKTQWISICASNCLKSVRLVAPAIGHYKLQAASSRNTISLQEVAT